jgi:hypothetical protein
VIEPALYSLKLLPFAVVGLGAIAAGLCHQRIRNAVGIEETQ